jgi:hypothetical protein
VATAGLEGGVAAAAEQARADHGAAIGLAVAAVRPGAQGRDVDDIAVADARGTECREHVLGGGAALAPARAAKFAIDLVRSRLAERGAAG